MPTMRPRVLVLAYFLAAAVLHPLLCQGAAAASAASVAAKFAMDGVVVDQGIDHFLVLAAVIVMCLFR
ncbi:hypothetical protein ACP70R_038212 [Stipagrostis hirtigluma subsp. patula]